MPRGSAVGAYGNRISLRQQVSGVRTPRVSGGVRMEG